MRDGTMRSTSSGCAGGMCKVRIKAPQPIDETKAADPIADADRHKEEEEEESEALRCR